MPQMSPLNWLILFIFFSLIFIFINMLNYFILNYKYSKKNNLKKINNKLNWKW
uniref:ATP synthase complex subunit 8 n=1 Tax=Cordylepherus sp. YY-2021 TaxID=2811245 RepID=A0A891M327_9CUCU|nr:ATP synthase F0 subunit 8 [Cordylepherus sp. YY-2021]